MHSHKKEGFSILVNTFSRAFYDQFPPFIRLNIRRGFFLHLLVRKSLNHKNFRLLLSFVVQNTAKTYAYTKTKSCCLFGRLCGNHQRRNSPVSTQSMCTLKKGENSSHSVVCVLKILYELSECMCDVEDNRDTTGEIQRGE